MAEEGQGKNGTVFHAQGETSRLVHYTTGTVDEVKMHNDSIHCTPVLSAIDAVKMEGGFLAGRERAQLGGLTSGGDSQET
jgi:hypothetical protein